MCFQPLSSCQLCLPLVEGPEAVGFEFQRAGDVKAVGGLHSQAATMPPRKLGAKFEGGLRYGSLVKQICGT